MSGDEDKKLSINLPEEVLKMLSSKMEKALNDQINLEMESAYLYLGMAAYAQTQNLNGVAHWLKLQYKEEMVHAMKLYDFVYERGGKVTLGDIKAPKTSWASALAIFEQTYKHECAITAKIYKLVDVAIAEKDKASESFLKWYVDEQVEEEAAADAIVQQLKFAGDKGPGLFMVDRELRSRGTH
jgi:ferritin